MQRILAQVGTAASRFASRQSSTNKPIVPQSCNWRDKSLSAVGSLFLMQVGYNRWAMYKLIDQHLNELSDSEYRADRGLYFKSIHMTMNHLLLASRLWYGRHTGYQIHINGLDDELCTDRQQLNYDIKEDCERWITLVKRWSNADLGATFTYTSTEVEEVKQSRAPMLAHYINHGTRCCRKLYSPV
eukprot:TRINITY_DN1297_c0_g1_i5.p1 TRINITY_DN1297_c0_g1~~TRINITY_DN1297_c0_g1_i5.p1  ORF type:complete len:186 (+),score=25.20 TRINITY_DN1297_c0_g1_i5:45-602(+)